MENVNDKIIIYQTADGVTKALEKVVYSQKVYDLIVNSGFTPVFEVPAE